MPDIQLITGTLTAIKTASDIVSAIRAADFSLEKSQLKLKIADLTDHLANATMSLARIQELILDKDAEIQRLYEALRTKAVVQKVEDAYYVSDENGGPVGDPYCLHCWETDMRLVHLVASAQSLYVRVCPACKTIYPTERVRPQTGKPDA